VRALDAYANAVSMDIDARQDDARARVRRCRVQTAIVD